MKGKVTQKKGKFNTLGGVNFIKGFMEHRKVASIINRQLGNRPAQCKFSYADTILGWAYCNISGAKRIEDCMTIKTQLETIPGVLIPSSDRIAQLMKKMSPESVMEESPKQTYAFSKQPVLNDLNIKVFKKLNLYSEGLLDYDNSLVYTRKKDSKKTYDFNQGYCPGVSFLDGCPIHVEGRAGNAAPSFRIKETIESVIEMCKSNNVKVNVLRSDAASYSKALFQYCDDNDVEFVIRAPKNIKEFDDDYQYSKFEPHVISGLNVETMSVKYTPHRMKQEYRVVLMKCVHKNGDMTRRAIITNNWKMSDKEIVSFYNMRGAIERNFDDLKNNFNLARPPFSYLNQNTTFWILSCMAFNIYKYCIGKLSKKVDRLKPNFRLKKFIQLFVRVTSHWKDGTLTLFTDLPYPDLV